MRPCRAEALGRFGQNGLFSAYYWTRPPAGSPVYWAFRAYRDYDGGGSQFLDWSVPTEVDDPDTGLSVFASTDESRDSIVMVVLNTSPDSVLHTSLELDGCQALGTVDTYGYDGDDTGFAPGEASVSGATVTMTLAPNPHYMWCVCRFDSQKVVGDEQLVLPVRAGRRAGRRVWRFRGCCWSRHSCSASRASAFRGRPLSDPQVLGRARVGRVQVHPAASDSDMSGSSPRLR